MKKLKEKIRDWYTTLGTKLSAKITHGLIKVFELGQHFSKHYPELGLSLAGFMVWTVVGMLLMMMTYLVQGILRHGVVMIYKKYQEKKQ